MKKLPIFLTIDVGPDGAAVGSGHTRYPTWGATFQGLGELKSATTTLEDELNTSIPLTYFIRADRLIRAQFGHSAHIYEKARKIIGADIGRSELAWMPQILVADEQSIPYEDLFVTHREMLDHGWEVCSTRMGDHFHNARTMACIEELRILNDSSALPGRIKHEDGWKLDWLNTTKNAYFPGELDYRCTGAKHRKVLEIPLTMTRIMASYDSYPIMRYANPCFQERYFWQNFEYVLSNSEYLVLIAHPDELVGFQLKKHPLIGYDSNTFTQNLRRMFHLANALGRIPAFHLVSEFRLLCSDFLSGGFNEACL